MEMKGDNLVIHLVQKLIEKIKLMQMYIEFEMIYKYQIKIITIIMLDNYFSIEI